MDHIAKIREILDINITMSWDRVRTQLKAVEDSDFGRGFYMGMLCARLELKSDMYDIEKISDEIE